MQALFLVTFIFEILFGLGFLIAPGTLFSTFGVTLNPSGISVARLFAAAVLALSTLAWYARSKDSAALKVAAARTMFVYWLVSTIVSLIAQLNGLLNTMGWSTIVMHLGFLIWTGAYAFKKETRA